MTDQLAGRTPAGQDGAFPVPSPVTSPVPSPVTAPVPSPVTELVTAPEAAPASGAGSGGGRGWTRRERLVLAGVAALLFAVYVTYAWARHAQYKTTGFDLGIFDQVVRAYAHAAVPTSPLKGIGYNILGDHFHPILVLLAPLYWVWDDPRMLLTAQAALFAVSIVPVAAFTRRRFGGPVALFAAFAYGASWPIQQAVHFDFHEIAFAVPLIALLIDALDRRAHRTVVVCCLLLLLVREDMGALVVLVGLLVAARGLWSSDGGRRGAAAGLDDGARPGGRRQGLLLGGGLAVAGLAGYSLATSVIIPAYGPAGFAYWTFSRLGTGPADAARTVLLHPLRVLRLMISPSVKFHTLVTIFYPTGFLALFSPYVLFTVPFLAERMLNDRRFLWETNFHYTSVIAPMVVMAAVDTAGRLVRRFPRALGSRRMGRPRLMRALPIGLATGLAAWSVGVVVFQSATGAPDYPVSGLWTGRVWSHDARWYGIRDVLPKIPAGECVEADNEIAPQLTRRDYVTRVTSAPGSTFHVRGSEGLSTWVVLDLDPKRPDTGWEGDRPRVAFEAAKKRGYAVVWQGGPIVLLHKDQPVARVCRGLY